MKYTFTTTISAGSDDLVVMCKNHTVEFTPEELDQDLTKMGVVTLSKILSCVENNLKVLDNAEACKIGLERQYNLCKFLEGETRPFEEWILDYWLLESELEEIEIMLNLLRESL